MDAIKLKTFPWQTNAKLKYLAMISDIMGLCADMGLFVTAHLSQIFRCGLQWTNVRRHALFSTVFGAHLLKEAKTMQSGSEINT